MWEYWLRCVAPASIVSSWTAAPASSEQKFKGPDLDFNWGCPSLPHFTPTLASCKASFLPVHATRKLPHISDVQVMRQHSCLQYPYCHRPGRVTLRFSWIWWGRAYLEIIRDSVVVFIRGSHILRPGSICLCYTCFWGGSLKSNATVLSSSCLFLAPSSDGKSTLFSFYMLEKEDKINFRRRKIPSTLIPEVEHFSFPSEKATHLKRRSLERNIGEQTKAEAYVWSAAVWKAA